MAYSGGITDVKSSTVTSSGRIETYTGSSSYIGRARIKAINANPSGAGATVKLYNGSSAVAASIVLDVKFGSAAGGRWLRHVHSTKWNFMSGWYLCSSIIL